jgi:hypothetical protein
MPEHGLTCFDLVEMCEIEFSLVLTIVLNILGGRKYSTGLLADFWMSLNA